MKAKFFLVMLSTLTTTAWACPNLAGTWSCTSEEGVEQIVVEQNGQQIRVTDDQGNVQDILADGVTRDKVIEGQTEDGTPFYINVKETASCTPTTVNHNIQSVPSPEFPYSFTINGVWTKVNDSRAQANFTTNMMGEVRSSQTNCNKL